MQASAPSSETLSVDVAIVGGGMVGASLAIGLGVGGLSVAVIERASSAQMTDMGFDGRTAAIAQACKRMFDATGVWPMLAPDACPIDDIRVSDGPSLLHLHFDHRDVARDGEKPAPFGYIVENRHTRLAQLARMEQLPQVKLLLQTTLGGIVRGDNTVSGRLSDGRQLRASLLVSAEGRDSPLRQQAGIAVTQWRYKQTGIVCTVAHQHPHGNVAQERFLPSGPFAILPMRDDEQGRHRSSIVWTEREDLAPSLMKLDQRGFAAELALRFGDYLGAVEPIGGRWSYPLGLLHAERYIDKRLALVGDAAHAIHPIAGQGLNMGLRDVAALIELLVEAKRLGLDLGSESLLAQYQGWRRVDNMTLVAVTDGLNRLFATDAAPIRLVRDLGLAAVNRIAPLKRFFMRHAMGQIGELPRLLRGELP